MISRYKVFVIDLQIFSQAIEQKFTARDEIVGIVNVSAGWVEKDA